MLNNAQTRRAGQVKVVVVTGNPHNFQEISMRTNQTTNNAGSKQVPASTGEMDAIALLTDDHEKVKSMFE